MTTRERREIMQRIVRYFVTHPIQLAAVMVMTGVFTFVTVIEVTASQEVAPGDVVAILDRDPLPRDPIDLETVPARRIPLDLGSFRRIFEDGGSAYWVGVDIEGKVCLISKHVTSSSEWAAALSCLTPEAVRERGLWLRLMVGGEGSDVTLIADGIISEELRVGVRDAGGAVLVDNLVVFPLDKRPHRLVVRTGLGFDLDLGVPQS